MDEYKGKTIAVSGGFDPVHIGHVRMFQAAKKLVGANGRLVVILNGDAWLVRKKGNYFMNQNDRAEIIDALSDVDETCIWESSDDHVCGALERLRPDIFANGGDRRSEKDIPEVKTCKELGIRMLFNIGGNKVRSSSTLLTAFKAKQEKT